MLKLHLESVFVRCCFVNPLTIHQIIAIFGKNSHVTWRKRLSNALKMLRTMIFLYVPNFGFICILQAKNIANKQFIPDYSLDPGLKLLESVSSEKNSWMGFSRRLSKSSNLHISVHFKPFAGQLQIERWHDLVWDEDNSSSMAVSTGSPFIQWMSSLFSS